MFLQIKEAIASVLEPYLPKSRNRQPGEPTFYARICGWMLARSGRLEAIQGV